MQPSGGPQPGGLCLFTRRSKGAKTVFKSLIKHRGSFRHGLSGPGLGTSHGRWAIVSPILQMRKVRFREAKSAGPGCMTGMWERRGWSQCFRLMPLAGDWGDTSKGQVIAACILSSPQPWPLALSLTFNQVPVMSSPATGAGLPQLLCDKWFSFEREVIKTQAQGHCQGIED